MNEVKLNQVLSVVTIVFFTLGIWNIYQSHKYRKMEHELRIRNCE